MSIYLNCANYCSLELLYRFAEVYDFGGGGYPKKSVLKGISLKRENELLYRFDNVCDLGGGTKKTVR